MVVIDVRIIPYNCYSASLLKLHVIGRIHTHICIHCIQVHRVDGHSILVNHQSSSRKLKRKKIGLTLVETSDRGAVRGF